MPKLEPTAGVAVVGLAGFQLLQAWNANAPSMAELRDTPPNTTDWHYVKQRLHDADFMVGGLAIILGVSFALMTHDMTALVVMLVTFGAVSIWNHAVLNAER